MFLEVNLCLHFSIRFPDESLILQKNSDHEEMFITIHLTISVQLLSVGNTFTYLPFNDRFIISLNIYKVSFLTLFHHGSLRFVQKHPYQNHPMDIVNTFSPC